ncbi:MAG: hypothetical protein ACI4D2_03470 [Lachnospiraceae bacterium]
MMNPVSYINNSGSYPKGSMDAIAPISFSSQNAQAATTLKNPSESTMKAPGRKSSPAECETCKNRKYQDGSDENVSFKTPTRISPGSAASAVRAHEQEHVSNAYEKAAKNNGKVLSANVAIHTAICPECGRSYVSGGTTSTQIKYFNEDNPYQKDLKNADAVKYTGMNVNIAC